MKALMILSDSIYPPDIRVKKEGESLVRNGWDVHLFAENREQCEYEIIGGIKVHRVKITQANYLSRILFKTSVMFKAIAFVKKEKIDLIHVHDLHLAFISMIVGKVTNRPVVLDLHENYPGAFEFGARDLLNPIIHKVMHIYLKGTEKIVCKLATKIIVVVEEAKERIVELGISPEKIAIVSNLVDCKRLDNIKSENKSLVSPSVMYVGGCTPHRGVDTLIEAMGFLSRDSVDCHLYLVGGKSAEFTNISKLIKKHKVEDRVTVTGWIPFDEAIGYLQAADITVIPHHMTSHTDTTVPHKLFQYMYLRKPALVSDVRPLKRIVNETSSGLVYTAGDPKDLAIKIKQLITNPEMSKVMGDKGHNAVIEKYNWEQESKSLLSLYEEIKKGKI